MSIIKFTFIISALFLLSILKPVYGQTGVAIAATTSTADPSAMLDIQSTSKGALVPRMTNAQRSSISTPANGLLVFCTDAPSGFYYNSGTSSSPNWVILSAGALTGTGTTNYDAMWTGSGTLGSGNIYNSGTNVGIGTSSAPGATFSVGGTTGNFQVTSAGAITGTSLSISGSGEIATKLSVGTASSPVQTLSVNGNGGFWNSNELSFYTDAGSTQHGFVGEYASGSDFSLAATTTGNWMRIGANAANIAFFPDGTLATGSSPLVTFGPTGIVDITNLAGTGTRPVWADASGNLNNNGRITVSGGTTYTNIAHGTAENNYVTTGTMSIVSGELIRIDGYVSVTFPGGSGTDHWIVTIRTNGSSGCGSTTIAVVPTAQPGSSNRGTYYPFPFSTYWTANCTGNVTFTIDVNTQDADDNWDINGATLVATKQ